MAFDEEGNYSFPVYPISLISNQDEEQKNSYGASSEQPQKRNFSSGFINYETPPDPRVKLAAPAQDLLQLDPDPLGTYTEEVFGKPRSEIVSLNVIGKPMSVQELYKTEAGQRLVELARKKRNHEAYEWHDALTDFQASDIPFVGLIASVGGSAMDASLVSKTLKKLQNGDKVSDEELIKTSLYLNESSYKSEGGWPVMLAEIARSLPGLAIEIGASGGAAAAARSAIAKSASASTRSFSVKATRAASIKAMGEMLEEAGGRLGKELSEDLTKEAAELTFNRAQAEFMQQATAELGEETVNKIVQRNQKRVTTQVAHEFTDSLETLLLSRNTRMSSHHMAELHLKDAVARKLGKDINKLTTREFAENVGKLSRKELHKVFKSVDDYVLSTIKAQGELTSGALPFVGAGIYDGLDGAMISALSRNVSQKAVNAIIKANSGGAVSRSVMSALNGAKRHAISGLLDHGIWGVTSTTSGFEKALTAKMGFQQALGSWFIDAPISGLMTYGIAKGISQVPKHFIFGGETVSSNQLNFETTALFNNNDQLMNDAKGLAFWADSLEYISEASGRGFNAFLRSLGVTLNPKLVSKAILTDDVTKGLSQRTIDALTTGPKAVALTAKQAEETATGSFVSRAFSKWFGTTKQYREASRAQRHQIFQKHLVDKLGVSPDDAPRYAERLARGEVTNMPKAVAEALAQVGNKPDKFFDAALTTYVDSSYRNFKTLARLKLQGAMYMMDHGYSPSGLLSHLEEVGYDGILAEMSEERYKDIVQPLLGLDDEDDHSVPGRFATAVKNLKFDKDRFIAEIVGFSLPLVSRAVAIKAQRRIFGMNIPGYAGVVNEWAHQLNDTLGNAGEFTEEMEYGRYSAKIDAKIDEVNEEEIASHTRIAELARANGVEVTQDRTGRIIGDPVSTGKKEIDLQIAEEYNKIAEAKEYAEVLALAKNSVDSEVGIQNEDDAAAADVEAIQNKKIWAVIPQRGTTVKDFHMMQEHTQETLRRGWENQEELTVNSAVNLARIIDDSGRRLDGEKISWWRSFLGQKVVGLTLGLATGDFSLTQANPATYMIQDISGNMSFVNRLAKRRRDVRMAWMKRWEEEHEGKPAQFHLTKEEIDEGVDAEFKAEAASIVRNGLQLQGLRRFADREIKQQALELVVADLSNDSSDDNTYNITKDGVVVVDNSGRKLRTETLEDFMANHEDEIETKRQAIADRVFDLITEGFTHSSGVLRTNGQRNVKKFLHFSNKSSDLGFSVEENNAINEAAFALSGFDKISRVNVLTDETTLADSLSDGYLNVSNKLVDSLYNLATGNSGSMNPADFDFSRVENSETGSVLLEALAKRMGYKISGSRESLAKRNKEIGEFVRLAHAAHDPNILVYRGDAESVQEFAENDARFRDSNVSTVVVRVDPTAEGDAKYYIAKLDDLHGASEKIYDYLSTYVGGERMTKEQLDKMFAELNMAESEQNIVITPVSTLSTSDLHLMLKKLGLVNEYHKILRGKGLAAKHPWFKYTISNGVNEDGKVTQKKTYDFADRGDAADGEVTWQERFESMLHDANLASVAGVSPDALDALSLAETLGVSRERAEEIIENTKTLFDKDDGLVPLAEELLLKYGVNIEGRSELSVSTVSGYDARHRYTLHLGNKAAITNVSGTQYLTVDYLNGRGYKQVLIDAVLTRVFRNHLGDIQSANRTVLSPFFRHMRTVIQHKLDTLETLKDPKYNETIRQLAELRDNVFTVRRVGFTRENLAVLRGDNVKLLLQAIGLMQIYQTDQQGKSVVSSLPYGEALHSIRNEMRSDSSFYNIVSLFDRVLGGSGFIDTLTEAILGGNPNTSRGIVGTINTLFGTDQTYQELISRSVITELTAADFLEKVQEAAGRVFGNIVSSGLKISEDSALRDDAKRGLADAKEFKKFIANLGSAIGRDIEGKTPEEVTSLVAQFNDALANLYQEVMTRAVGSLTPDQMTAEILGKINTTADKHNQELLSRQAELQAKEKQIAVLHDEIAVLKNRLQDIQSGRDPETAADVEGLGKLGESARPTRPEGDAESVEPPTLDEAQTIAFEFSEATRRLHEGTAENPISIPENLVNIAGVLEKTNGRNLPAEDLARYNGATDLLQNIERRKKETIDAILSKFIRIRELTQNIEQGLEEANQEASREYLKFLIDTNRELDEMDNANIPPENQVSTDSVVGVLAGHEFTGGAESDYSSNHDPFSAAEFFEGFDLDGSLHEGSSTVSYRDHYLPWLREHLSKTRPPETVGLIIRTVEKIRQRMASGFFSRANSRMFGRILTDASLSTQANLEGGETEEVVETPVDEEAPTPVDDTDEHGADAIDEENDYSLHQDNTDKQTKIDNRVTYSTLGEYLSWAKNDGRSPIVVQETMTIDDDLVNVVSSINREEARTYAQMAFTYHKVTGEELDEKLMDKLFPSYALNPVDKKLVLATVMANLDNPQVLGVGVEKLSPQDDEFTEDDPQQYNDRVKVATDLTERTKAFETLITRMFPLANGTHAGFMRSLTDGLMTSLRVRMEQAPDNKDALQNSVAARIIKILNPRANENCTTHNEAYAYQSANLDAIFGARELSEADKVLKLKTAISEFIHDGMTMTDRAAAMFLLYLHGVGAKERARFLSTTTFATEANSLYVDHGTQSLRPKRVFEAKLSSSVLDAIVNEFTIKSRKKVSEAEINEDFTYAPGGVSPAGLQGKINAIFNEYLTVPYTTPGDGAGEAAMKKSWSDHRLKIYPKIQNIVSDPEAAVEVIRKVFSAVTIPLAKYLGTDSILIQVLNSDRLLKDFVRSHSAGTLSAFLEHVFAGNLYNLWDSEGKTALGSTEVKGARTTKDGLEALESALSRDLATFVKLLTKAKTVNQRRDACLLLLQANTADPLVKVKDDNSPSFDRVNEHYITNTPFLGQILAFAIASQNPATTKAINESDFRNRAYDSHVVRRLPGLPTVLHEFVYSGKFKEMNETLFGNRETALGAILDGYNSDRQELRWSDEISSPLLSVSLNTDRNPLAVLDSMAKTTFHALIGGVVSDTMRERINRSGYFANTRFDNDNLVYQLFAGEHSSKTCINLPASKFRLAVLKRLYPMLTNLQKLKLEALEGSTPPDESLDKKIDDCLRLVDTFLGLKDPNKKSLHKGLEELQLFLGSSRTKDEPDIFDVFHVHGVETFIYELSRAIAAKNYLDDVIEEYTAARKEPGAVFDDYRALYDGVIEAQQAFDESCYILYQILGRAVGTELHVDLLGIDAKRSVVTSNIARALPTTGYRVTTDAEGNEKIETGDFRFSVLMSNDLTGFKENDDGTEVNLEGNENLLGTAYYGGYANTVLADQASSGSASTDKFHVGSGHNGIGFEKALSVSTDPAGDEYSYGSVAHRACSLAKRLYLEKDTKRPINSFFIADLDAYKVNSLNSKSGMFRVHKNGKSYSILGAIAECIKTTPTLLGEDTKDTVTGKEIIKSSLNASALANILITKGFDFSNILENNKFITPEVLEQLKAQSGTESPAPQPEGAPAQPNTTAEVEIRGNSVSVDIAKLLDVLFPKLRVDLAMEFSEDLAATETETSAEEQAAPLMYAVSYVDNKAYFSPVANVSHKAEPGMMKMASNNTIDALALETNLATYYNEQGIEFRPTVSEQISSYCFINAILTNTPEFMTEVLTEMREKIKDLVTAGNPASGAVVLDEINKTFAARRNKAANFEIHGVYTPLVSAGAGAVETKVPASDMYGELTTYKMEDGHTATTDLTMSRMHQQMHYGSVMFPPSERAYYRCGRRVALCGINMSESKGFRYSWFLDDERADKMIAEFSADGRGDAGFKALAKAMGEEAYTHLNLASESPEIKRCALIEYLFTNLYKSQNDPKAVAQWRQKIAEIFTDHHNGHIIDQPIRAKRFQYEDLFFKNVNTGEMEFDRTAVLSNIGKHNDRIFMDKGRDNLGTGKSHIVLGGSMFLIPRTPSYNGSKWNQTVRAGLPVTERMVGRPVVDDQGNVQRLRWAAGSAAMVSPDPYTNIILGSDHDGDTSKLGFYSSDESGIVQYQKLDDFLTDLGTLADSGNVVAHQKLIAALIEKGVIVKNDEGGYEYADMGKVSNEVVRGLFTLSRNLPCLAEMAPGVFSEVVEEAAGDGRSGRRAWAGSLYAQPTKASPLTKASSTILRSKGTTVDATGKVRNEKLGLDDVRPSNLGFKMKEIVDPITGFRTEESAYQAGQGRGKIVALARALHFAYATGTFRDVLTADIIADGNSRDYPSTSWIKLMNIVDGLSNATFDDIKDQVCSVMGWTPSTLNVVISRLISQGFTDEGQAPTTDATALAAFKSYLGEYATRTEGLGARGMFRLAEEATTGSTLGRGIVEAMTRTDIDLNSTPRKKNDKLVSQKDFGITTEKEYKDGVLESARTVFSGATVSLSNALINPDGSLNLDAFNGKTLPQVIGALIYNRLDKVYAPRYGYPDQTSRNSQSYKTLYNRFLRLIIDALTQGRSNGNLSGGMFSILVAFSDINVDAPTYNFYNTQGLVQDFGRFYLNELKYRAVDVNMDFAELIKRVNLYVDTFLTTDRIGVVSDTGRILNTAKVNLNDTGSVPLLVNSISAYSKVEEEASKAQADSKTNFLQFKQYSTGKDRNTNADHGISPVQSAIQKYDYASKLFLSDFTQDHRARRKIGRIVGGVRSGLYAEEIVGRILSVTDKTGAPEAGEDLQALAHQISRLLKHRGAVLGRSNRSLVLDQRSQEAMELEDEMFPEDFDDGENEPIDDLESDGLGEYSTESDFFEEGFINYHRTREQTPGGKRMQGNEAIGASSFGYDERVARQKVLLPYTNPKDLVTNSQTVTYFFSGIIDLINKARAKENLDDSSVLFHSTDNNKVAQGGDKLWETLRKNLTGLAHAMVQVEMHYLTGVEDFDGQKSQKSPTSEESKGEDPTSPFAELSEDFGLNAPVEGGTEEGAAPEEPDTESSDDTEYVPRDGDLATSEVDPTRAICHFIEAVASALYTKSFANRTGSGNIENVEKSKIRNAMLYLAIASANKFNPAADRKIQGAIRIMDRTMRDHITKTIELTKKSNAPLVVTFGEIMREFTNPKVNFDVYTKSFNDYAPFAMDITITQFFEELLPLYTLLVERQTTADPVGSSSVRDLLGNVSDISKIQGDLESGEAFGDLLDIATALAVRDPQTATKSRGRGSAVMDLFRHDQILLNFTEAIINRYNSKGMLRENDSLVSSIENNTSNMVINPPKDETTEAQARRIEWNASSAVSHALQSVFSGIQGLHVRQVGPHVLLVNGTIVQHTNKNGKIHRVTPSNFAITVNLHSTIDSFASLKKAIEGAPGDVSANGIKVIESILGTTNIKRAGGKPGYCLTVEDFLELRDSQDEADQAILEGALKNMCIGGAAKNKTLWALDGRQVATLCGAVTASQDDPDTVYHELFHTFLSMYRSLGAFVAEDVAAFREVFGKSASEKGWFNEERAAEAFRLLVTQGQEAMHKYIDGEFDASTPKKKKTLGALISALIRMKDFLLKVFEGITRPGSFSFAKTLQDGSRDENDMIERKHRVADVLFGAVLQGVYYESSESSQARAGGSRKWAYDLESGILADTAQYLESQYQSRKVAVENDLNIESVLPQMAGELSASVHTGLGKGDITDEHLVAQAIHSLHLSEKEQLEYLKRFREAFKKGADRVIERNDIANEIRYSAGTIKGGDAADDPVTAKTWDEFKNRRPEQTRTVTALGQLCLDAWLSAFAGINDPSAQRFETLLNAYNSDFGSSVDGLDEATYDRVANDAITILKRHLPPGVESNEKLFKNLITQMLQSGHRLLTGSAFSPKGFSTRFRNVTPGKHHASQFDVAGWIMSSNGVLPEDILRPVMERVDAMRAKYQEKVDGEMIVNRCVAIKEALGHLLGDINFDNIFGNRNAINDSVSRCLMTVSAGLELTDPTNFYGGFRKALPGENYELSIKDFFKRRYRKAHEENLNTFGLVLLSGHQTGEKVHDINRLLQDVIGAVDLVAASMKFYAAAGAVPGSMADVIRTKETGVGIPADLDSFAEDAGISYKALRNAGNLYLDPMVDSAYFRRDTGGWLASQVMTTFGNAPLRELFQEDHREFETIVSNGVRAESFFNMMLGINQDAGTPILEVFEKESEWSFGSGMRVVHGKTGDTHLSFDNVNRVSTGITLTPDEVRLIRLYVASITEGARGGSKVYTGVRKVAFSPKDFGLSTDPMVNDDPELADPVSRLPLYRHAYGTGKPLSRFAMALLRLTDYQFENVSSFTGVTKGTTTEDLKNPDKKYLYPKTDGGKNPTGYVYKLRDAIEKVKLDVISTWKQEAKKENRHPTAHRFNVLMLQALEREGVLRTHFKTDRKTKEITSAEGVFVFDNQDIRDAFEASSAYQKLLRAGRRPEWLTPEFLSKDLLDAHNNAHKYAMSQTWMTANHGMGRYFHSYGSKLPHFIGTGYFQYHANQVARTRGPGDMRRIEDNRKMFQAALAADELHFPSSEQWDTLMTVLDISGRFSQTEFIRQVQAGALKEGTALSNELGVIIEPNVHANELAVVIYQAARKQDLVFLSEGYDYKAPNNAARMGYVGDILEAARAEGLDETAGNTFREGVTTEEAYRLTGELPANYSLGHIVNKSIEGMATALFHRNTLVNMLTLRNIDNSPVYYMRPTDDAANGIPDALWAELARWWANENHLEIDHNLKLKSGKEQAAAVYDAIKEQNKGYRGKDTIGISDNPRARNNETKYHEYVILGETDIDLCLSTVSEVLCCSDDDAREGEGNTSILNKLAGGEAVGYAKHLFQANRTTTVLGPKARAAINRVFGWSKAMAVGYSFFFPIATKWESSTAAMGAVTALASNKKTVAKMVRKDPRLARMLQSCFGIGDASIDENFIGFADIIEMMDSNDPFIAELVDFANTLGISIATSSNDPLDLQQSTVRRDLANIEEWLRQTYGDGAAHNFHGLADALMIHQSDKNFQYALNATKLATVAQMLCKVRRHAKKSGKAFDPIRDMKKYSGYINAEVGGIDPLTTGWNHPTFRWWLSKSLFSWDWTVGAWLAGGGGVLEDLVFGGHRVTREERAFFLGRWFRMLGEVLYGFPMIMQALMKVISMLNGDPDDDDTKWFPWQNESKVTAFDGWSWDITPLMKLCNKHEDILKPVAKVASAFMAARYGFKRGGLLAGAAGGGLGFWFGDSLLPNYTGNDPYNQTTRGRKYYMHMGKQGQEFFRWFTQPLKQLGSKASLPIQKVYESLFGVSFSDPDFKKSWHPDNELDAGTSFAKRVANIFTIFAPFSGSSIGFIGDGGFADSGALSLFAPVQMGVSKSASTDQLKKEIFKIAEGKYQPFETGFRHHGKKKGDARRSATVESNLFTPTVTRILEEARTNGDYLSYEKLRQAVGSVRSTYIRQLFDLLPRPEDMSEKTLTDLDMAEIQRISRSLNRIGVLQQNIMDSFQNRLRSQNIQWQSNQLTPAQRNFYRIIIKAVTNHPDDPEAYILENKHRAATRQAERGGYAPGNFLASDEVPPTIFGFTVVSDPSMYTAADEEFFAKFPSAGGYYDMGDGDLAGEQGDQAGGKSKAKTAREKQYRVYYQMANDAHRNVASQDAGTATNFKTTPTGGGYGIANVTPDDVLAGAYGGAENAAIVKDAVLAARVAAAGDYYGLVYNDEDPRHLSNTPVFFPNVSNSSLLNYETRRYAVGGNNNLNLDDAKPIRIEYTDEPRAYVARRNDGAGEGYMISGDMASSTTSKSFGHEARHILNLTPQYYEHGWFAEVMNANMRENFQNGRSYTGENLSELTTGMASLKRALVRENYDLGGMTPAERKYTFRFMLDNPEMFQNKGSVKHPYKMDHDGMETVSYINRILDKMEGGAELSDYEKIVFESTIGSDGQDDNTVWDQIARHQDSSNNETMRA